MSSSKILKAAAGKSNELLVSLECLTSISMPWEPALVAHTCASHRWSDLDCTPEASGVLHLGINNVCYMRMCITVQLFPPVPKHCFSQTLLYTACNFFFPEGGVGLVPKHGCILRIPQMIWVWRATVEWYIDRGKPKNQPVTYKYPLCPKTE
jgi:hypothetical protein